MKIFESTIQKTNLWLKDVESVMRTDDRVKAYAALRAVLHVVRECLPIEESAKLAAQLPMLLAGVFFSGWKARRKPMRLTKSEFLDEVRSQLRGQGGVDPGLAARAVFCAIEFRVSSGEVESLRRVLPREVHQLWGELAADAAMREREREPEPEPESERVEPEPHMQFEPIDPMHAWQPGWGKRQLGEQSQSGGFSPQD